jgi:hypothetical protein
LANRFQGHTDACCGGGLGFSATFFLAGTLAAALELDVFTTTGAAAATGGLVLGVAASAREETKRLRP